MFFAGVRWTVERGGMATIVEQYGYLISDTASSVLDRSCSVAIYLGSFLKSATSLSAAANLEGAIERAQTVDIEIEPSRLQRDQLTQNLRSFRWLHRFDAFADRIDQYQVMVPEFERTVGALAKSKITPASISDADRQMLTSHFDSLQRIVHVAAELTRPIADPRRCVPLDVH
jgi:hypothetical protein